MSRPEFGWTRVALCVVFASIAAIGTGVGVATGQEESQDAPRSISPPLTPAITEIEAEWKGNGRIRLHAQVVPRGTKVVKVTFRYRDKRFTATRQRLWKYAKTVKARGGDRKGDRVRFRVRGCTATRCTARTGSDKAD
jgi:hypothetical protein